MDELKEAIKKRLIIGLTTGAYNQTPNEQYLEANYKSNKKLIDHQTEEMYKFFEQYGDPNKRELLRLRERLSKS